MIQPLPCLLFLLATGLSVWPLRAATYVWSGAGANAQWSNPANWLGGVAPAPNETGLSLVFSNGITSRTITNDLAGLVVANLRFQGSNYVLHGKPAGTALKLYGSGFLGFGITANDRNNQLASTCPLVVSNFGTVTVNGANTLKLASVLSGPGGFTKAGPGTLLCNAPAANALAGGMVVLEGFLDLQGTGVAVPANLTIGNADTNTTATVRLLADHQIGDSVGVTINENGRLWLNTHQDTLGPLTFRGGTASTGANGGPNSPGVLTLNGNVTNLVSSLGYFGSLSGNLNLGLLTRTFSVARNSRLNVDAAIAGGSVAPFLAGFTLVDGGTLRLVNGANTYSGLTTVEDGTLSLTGNTSLLGSTNAGTVVNSNGVLLIAGCTNLYEPLTLNGGTNPLVRWLGTNAWRGNLTLNGACRFDNASDLDELSLPGVITGDGGLHKTGNGGVLRLDGASTNTFTGGLVVEAGTVVGSKIHADLTRSPVTVGGLVTNSTALLLLTGLEQIPDDVPVRLFHSGTWRQYWASYETIGHLECTGGTLDPLPGFAPGIVFLSGNVTNHSAPAPGGGFFSSAVQGSLWLPAGTHIFHSDPQGFGDLRGTLDGPGGVTKTGAGFLTYFSTNAYLGLTTVLDGQLSLYGGLPGAIDSGTVVGGNGVLEIAGNAAVTNELLVVQAGGRVAWDDNHFNRWHGQVMLEANVEFFSFANGQLLLDGAVSGPGGITLASYNHGNLALTGSAENTYSGATRVNQGTLLLGKLGTYAIAGDLIVGDPDNLAHTAVLSLGKTNQFTPATGSQLLTRTVTLNASAMVAFNADQQFANLVLASAELDTGSATLALHRNLSVQGQVAGLHSTLAGRLALAKVGGVSNHVLQVSGDTRLSLSAAITETGGAASLEKTGSGFATLSASNALTGLITVMEGGLRALHPFALGSPNVGTVVQPGAYVSFVNTTNAEPFTIAGLKALQAEALTTNQLNGPITLADHAGVHTWFTNTALSLAGAIGGPGDLTISGLGRFRLAGASPNVYAGQTHLAGGVLELAKSAGTAIPGDFIVGEPGGLVRWLASHQVADSSAVVLTNAGSAALNGYSETLGSLAGNQILDLGAGTLTVGANQVSTLYSGLLSGVGGGLTKVGTGTLTLTADHAYTGLTTVNGGQLIVQGSQPASPVYVATGTLAGTGTVGNVTIANAGTLSPGTSPGRLNCGTLNLIGNNAKLDVELHGPTPGTDYDQVKVTGNVSFMGGRLALALHTLGAVGQQYVILDNDGLDSVGGYFTGLPEGATLTNHGAVFQITYHGGDGNDVALIQQSVFAPNITAVTVSNGQLHLTGLGLPNATYTLQATENLTPPVQWSNLATVPADANGVLQFSAGDVTSFPLRFYRLQEP